MSREERGNLRKNKKTKNRKFLDGQIMVTNNYDFSVFKFILKKKNSMKMVSTFDNVGQCRLGLKNNNLVSF